MGTVKPWQIVVMVLAVLAVGGSAFYSCSGTTDKVVQSNSATMVDIRTGDLFEATYPEKRPVRYPAKHPTTGTESLFPVFAVEGKWKLDGRYIPRIKADKALKADLIADRDGYLSISGTSPTKADIFGK